MDAGTALRTHRLILRSASALANAFAWIFIFEYFYSIGGNLELALVRVVLLYALSQTTAALLTPLTARGLRHGMKSQMIFGVLSVATAFIFLGAVFSGLFAPIYTLATVAFALLLGIYRALYWVPYEVERNEIQAPPSKITHEILIALMPAFAGYMLALGGMHEAWLLFIAGVLMIIALVLLKRVPDVYERFLWNYRETFGQLFDRAHRRLFFGAMIDGIQGATLLLIWPIAIFLMVDWSYQIFGTLFSCTLLVFILTRDGIERYMRRFRVFDSLPIRVAIVSSAWVGRILVPNPLSVVVIDTYAHIGNSKIATDHLAFEQSSDGGHFIDQFSALREIGLSIGRIVLCAFAAVLAGAFPLPFVFGSVFVIAGISAGLSIILSHIPHRSL